MSANITWLSIDSTVPMGQQHAEHGAREAIVGAAPAGWKFETRRVTSWRTAAPGDLRLPRRAVDRLPLAAAAQFTRRVTRGADLVHRWELRIPPAAGRIDVVTVNDFAPLRFPDEGSLPRWAVASLRRAAVVLCPSNAIADEVVDRVGAAPVEVLPIGITPAFFEGARSPVPDELGRIRFVLHAGGATQRKNLAGLRDAWSMLAPSFPDVELVLCGPHDERRSRLFASLPRVRLVGRVPLATLVGLMARAEVVIVPSVYEGYGLPVLEAMAAGTAVVTVARASLPEVAGGAAVLAEPTGPSLADATATLLSDAGLRGELEIKGRRRAEEFRWDGLAHRYVDIYRSLVSAR